MGNIEVENKDFSQLRQIRESMEVRQPPDQSTHRIFIASGEAQGRSSGAGVGHFNINTCS